MKVHVLKDAPPSDLASALERFESAFVYPLGPGRTFRISHGADYPRFFRAMGEARCFVATRDDQVLGVAGVAIRTIVTPEGETSAAYIGDVKVASEARGGRVLVRLADAMKEWLGDRVTAAYGVVMDGTRVTPERYTGRLGIPAFREIGKIVVLRVNSLKQELVSDWTAEDFTGMECFRRLAAGRHATVDGNPTERSEITPLWLVNPGGRACGRLEDTRRAKRLIADDGSEMMSAHLSCFVYETPSAGVDLLNAARDRALRLGYPAMFVAVPPEDVDDFRSALGPDTVMAPSTIFGTGVTVGGSWVVNTAEI